MSEPAAPLTPEQEARIRAIVRELLPEIIQATAAALRAAVQYTRTVTDDGRLTYRPDSPSDAHRET